MAQYTWPPVTASNPSVGGTGITAPTSATEIGGVNAGNLVPVAVTSGGVVLVSNIGGNASDTNYGVVGVNTLRTAAEIGNATGAADFNAGATSAQTLRVQANQGAAAAIAAGWTVKPTDGTNSQAYLATGEAKVSVTQPLPAGTAVIGHVITDTGSTTTVTQATAANLNATVVGAGTAGTPSGGVVSIQGVASGTVVPVSGTVTVTSTTANQGTANTAANGWPVKLTDGTNVTAVKAASTAALATDPSAVVALSPNSPIPTGSNVIGSLAANQSINNAQVSGTAISVGSGVNGTGVQRVTIATDNAAIATKSPVNVNGSIVNTTLTGTTASSNTAPTNAVGFILEAESTNTNNIRWCIGGTASASVGSLMEPGRDTGYVPCATTISVCATVSGTNVFSIQWILSA